MKEHHHMYIGLIIACLLLAVGVILLTISPSSSSKTLTPLTNQNPILPMQQNSLNEDTIQNTDDVIPPPPIVIPDEINEPEPILSDEYELITLVQGVPFTFHGTTLILEGFNHKFQDSAHSEFVWMDVSVHTDELPTSVDKIGFNYRTFIDKQGTEQTSRTKSAYNGYMFELSDFGYDYSIDLIVRKILNDS